ncbi:MAG: hypothetical protein HY924_12565 [Elusimicrobia bacterium]|nr:hypothetical protein [Elusimicrobiota bacterium]
MADARGRRKGGLPLAVLAAACLSLFPAQAQPVPSKAPVEGCADRYQDSYADSWRLTRESWTDACRTPQRPEEILAQAQRAFIGACRERFKPFAAEKRVAEATVSGYCAQGRAGESQLSAMFGLPPEAKVPERTRPSPTASEAVFQISTKPSLRFSRGRDTYALGQDMGKFLSSFGRAEETSEEWSSPEFARAYLGYTREYKYLKDGLSVSADQKGRIKSLTFYVGGVENMGTATVRKGAVELRGRSLDGIIELYGKPLKSVVDGSNDTIIYYRFGDEVLSFTFRKDALGSIGMHARYLTYLSCTPETCSGY